MRILISDSSEPVRAGRMPAPPISQTAMQEQQSTASLAR